MIVGHPNRRSYDIDPNLTASKAVSLRCFVQELDLGAGTPGVGPEDSFDFPEKMCPGAYIKRVNPVNAHWHTFP